MFSELPKLFDRNFVIAYFLPVSLFVISSGLLRGYWPKVQAALSGSSTIDPALIAFNTTLVVFFAWIGGVLLMVLNRIIYRILEGYYKVNPLRIFEKREKKRFEEKLAKLSRLDQEYTKSEFNEKLNEERTLLMQELAERYPDNVELVLPTEFGNALRAFEIYPRVMYGMEGIDGWSRILAVVPSEYRELIDSAKAQVDWWVNLGVLSIVFIAEFWITIFSRWRLTLPWHYTVLNLVVPLVLLLSLNWLFYRGAIDSAIGWGDYVKSAFDLYRFNLLESLGIDLPKSREEERELWTKYSQAIIYRLPDTLPELKDGTAKPVTRKAKSK